MIFSIQELFYFWNLRTMANCQFNKLLCSHSTWIVEKSCNITFPKMKQEKYMKTKINNEMVIEQWTITRFEWCASWNKMLPFEFKWPYLSSSIRIICLELKTDTELFRCENIVSHYLIDLSEQFFQRKIVNSRWLSLKLIYCRLFAAWNCEWVLFAYC